MILKYGSEGENVRLVQRALNEILGLDLVCDGKFGKLTEENIRKYQTINKFMVNGFLNILEENDLTNLIKNKYLTTKDIKQLAINSSIEPEMLLAFSEVEGSGRGFSNSGTLLMLFERHHYFKYVSNKFGEEKAIGLSKLYPNICNKERGGYLGGDKETSRLEQAMKFDKELAYMSTSFGMFQILGSNHKVCGFNSAKDFYENQLLSEKNQLKAVINFIINNSKLLNAIKNRKFEDIALIYNGPRYKDFSYDDKLRKAYQKFKS